eukprot:4084741-Prymnesium_polylepis.1
MSLTCHIKPWPRGLPHAALAAWLRGPYHATLSHHAAFLLCFPRGACLACDPCLLASQVWNPYFHERAVDKLAANPSVGRR